MPQSICVDGTAIQKEIKDRLAREFRGRGARLGVILAGSEPSSVRYVSVKKQFGSDIGVDVVVHSLPDDAPEERVAGEVLALAQDRETHGVIVQLPLPPHVSTEKILALLPREKDVDALGGTPSVVSPVARSVARILSHYGVAVVGAEAAIVGRGRLVGKPVASWLASAGARVSVISRDTSPEERLRVLLSADIIVSGVGKPQMVLPDEVKTGVVLIDAGVNTATGVGGDIDPGCYEKASLYSPPRGGVGAVTLAMLFDNLLELMLRQETKTAKETR